MSQSLWLDSKRLELVLFIYFVSKKTKQTRKEDTRNYFSLYFRSRYLTWRHGRAIQDNGGGLRKEIQNDVDDGR